MSIKNIPTQIAALNTKMNVKTIALSSFVGVSSLLLFANSAYALIGALFGAAASGVGYVACRDAAEIDGVITDAEAAACLLLVADPIGEDITNVEFSATFDASKFEVIPEPFYFGDFSESGAFFPLSIPIIGEKVSPEEYPDFNLNLALNPRTGASSSFVVDNTNGTLDLNMDLSANPVPGNSEPQNFFAFQLQLIDRKGAISGIEYFDTPGDYDVDISFTCTTTVEPPSCGSNTPVYGFNIHTVPEPASIFSLLAFGTLGTVTTLNRKLKSSNSTGKNLDKVS